MAEQNPTVIIAHLDDEKLRKSIDSLVGYVDENFKAMTTSTTNAVNTMQKELQKLGSLNAKGTGGAGCGELGITKALHRAKQEAKESSATFDQMAASMQKATTGNGNKTIFSTMDTEISILKERLVEAKSQVESFTVMARRGAETGDKGLFTFSTENLHKYEAEVATLTQQINSLTSQRQALKEMLNPQGDALKNYVDSLTKVNPELAALNAQYKEGKSLLQQQTDAVKEKTKVEETNATEIQKTWKMEQKLHQEQGKRYDAQNEINRQLEIENAKTAENLAFQERINAVRASKDGGVGKRVRETNELTGAIAGLLGIQEREVAVTNVDGASQHRLANYLNQLKTAYQRLDKEGMSASHGKMLADEIQRVSRAYAEMTKQMNRPTSLKNALGLDENTLDRIAYKMQQLNAYKMGLNITDPKQVAEMKRVEQEYDRLKKKSDELMGKNQQLMNSNNALARSWNYMKNRLAFYFTVGASTAFVKNLIEVRSQYEMNERALGILIDSAERGTQIFNELSQMALVSPYTLIELSTAAKQLSAYDVAAKDLVDTTRRLADISAAVGLPVERLTTALGQIKAFEHLTSMTARRFSSAGIPLVKALADHYTELEGRMVSVADVYDRMKKKAISYNDVMAVITEMTDEGGKFFDFQAKMADTLKVQLANLTLAWNNMLNEIGKSEQGVLVGGIKGLKELFLQWKNIEKAALAFGISLGAVKAAQILYLIFGAKINKQLAVQAVLGQKAAHAFDGLGASLMKVATNPWTWVTIGVAMLAELAITAYQADEAIKTLNKSIIDAANERVESLNKTIATINSKYNFEEIAPSEHRLALDTNKDEAKKIWENIREEIEMSSSSAQEFINRLENIDDINVRVGRGFDYLKDIQKAQAALSQIDIKDIDVEQDMAGWWNLYSLQDGLIENFRDMQKEAGRAEKDWKDYAIRAAQGFKFGVLGAIIGGVGIKGSEGEHLKRYQEDLQTTVDSIIASMKKYNVEGANVQREFFATSMDKILQDTDLTEKERLKIRIDAQELFYQSEVKSRQKAIDKEFGVYKRAYQRELDDFIAFHEQRNGYTLGFEQWLQKTQITMLTETFGKMSAEELKQIDFSKGEWSKWAYDISKKFAEQNNLSIDDVFANLRKYLSQDFTLYIKTVLQKPDDKSVYDTLTEADKAADEAWNKIQRLKTHKGELESKGAIVAGTRDIDTEYANTLKEITEAQDDYNAALAKGGHSKKENTTNTKAQKQAESELQKVIKEEVSLINKARSAYKNLTKDGVDSTKALTVATSGYENSIRKINNILAKNRLRQLDLSKYVGIENPRPILDFLNSQLGSGILNRQETETIEGIIRDLKIDVVSFDQKTLINSLNNELSKLKDEYELAVELDANPELGDMFTNMFGIDTSEFPKTIDQYMQRVQDEFDKGREKFNYQTPLNVFKATESDWIRWGASVGIVTAKLDEQGNIMADDTTALDKFKAKFVDAQGVAKKWATDIVNNTKKLEYDLAELNDKIAIKEKEQARLHEQIENEKNEVTKHYLELTYQNNQKAIDELKSQALSLMPEYARVFNSIAEHSAGVARRLQRDLMKVYDSATFDSASNSWTLTSSNGTQTKLSDTQYRKEREKLTKEMRKSQSNFQKIKEAFKPSDKDGVVDYAKAIELIGEEAKKAADGLHTIADIVNALGGSEDAVEVLNDVATSMEGVATAGQGIAQISSGDYIGGAVNVIKGAWQAVSTWLDNGDKKISRQIEASERQVRKLELAYIDLEHAIEDAYGMETIGAQKAAIANKQLQLAELKRQLTLEQSRKKKNQDQDRIIELQKQIKELEYDIKNMTDEIVNDLLGISSVGDAMESLMDGFVEALRSGEDAMAVFDDSIDNMIANMVKKMFTTKILQPWFEKQWDLIQKDIDERAGKELPKRIAELTGQVDTAKRADLNNRDSVWEALAAMGLSAEQIRQYENYDAAGNFIYDSSKRFERRKELYENILDQKEKELDKAQQEFTEATTPTLDDIRRWADMLRSGKITFEEWQKYMQGVITDLDLMTDTKDNALSNLQQGIRGVTEETAGALEAYMNGVSQQCYLQSDLLTQIRDAVVAIDSDVQLATNAQILLQLQQSYAVQMAIQSILVGWSNPSGQAVRVELLS